MFDYFKPYKWQALLGPLFKLAEATFELLVPFVVAKIVDDGLGAFVDGGYPHADKGYIFLMCGVLGSSYRARRVCAPSSWTTLPSPSIYLNE